MVIKNSSVFSGAVFCNKIATKNPPDQCPREEDRHEYQYDLKEFQLYCSVN